MPQHPAATQAHSRALNFHISNSLGTLKHAWAMGKCFVCPSEASTVIINYFSIIRAVLVLSLEYQVY